MLLWSELSILLCSHWLLLLVVHEPELVVCLWVGATCAWERLLRLHWLLHGLLLLHGHGGLRLLGLHLIHERESVEFWLLLWWLLLRSIAKQVHQTLLAQLLRRLLRRHWLVGGQRSSSLGRLTKAYSTDSAHLFHLLLFILLLLLLSLLFGLPGFLPLVLGVITV